VARLTDAQVVRAFNMLEIRPEDFRAVEQAPSFEECQLRLAALKERVNKRWKQLALTLHPDKTNNDPAKTEDFKLVSAAVDEFDKMQVGRAPPPRPMPQHVTIRVSFVRHGYSTTASTTSTTFGGFGF